MSLYYKYNLDEIKKELETRKDSKKEALKMWQAVQIKTKKDGSEFKQLARALEGASEVYEFGWRRLAVYYRTPARRHEEDTIDIYGYIDELPKEDPRSEQPHEIGWMRNKYDFTAAEVREAIKKRIRELQSDIVSLNAQIKKADFLYTRYREAVEEAERTLSEATKNGIFNNSLYHLITETR